MFVCCNVVVRLFHIFSCCYGFADLVSAADIVCFLIVLEDNQSDQLFLLVVIVQTFLLLFVKLQSTLFLSFQVKFVVFMVF